MLGKLLPPLQLFGGIGVVAAVGINATLYVTRATQPDSREQILAKRAEEAAANGGRTDGSVEVIVPAGLKPGQKITVTFADGNRGSVAPPP
jgi:hypothetical protein